MRIIIIRHGDPNYAIDGLTPTGKIEVDLLAKMLKERFGRGSCEDFHVQETSFTNCDVASLFERDSLGNVYIYSSPLGRARATSLPTEEALGIPAEVCDWLREFGYSKVNLPWEPNPAECWDLLPEFVNECGGMLYSPTEWKSVPFIRESNVPDDYDAVVSAFDALILKHGYKRDGAAYKVLSPNYDTLIFFCHYGISAVLLSHIMNCSPYSIWQNAVTLTTSLTTIHTEERREGIASFRICEMSATPHLYAAGVSPSFSARFCECFGDDTRHD